MSKKSQARRKLKKVARGAKATKPAAKKTARENTSIAGKIKDKASGAIDTVKEIARDVKDKAADMVDKVKEKLD